MRNEKGQFIKGFSPRLGIKHTEETKSKIREKILKNPPKYWLGKKLSEEHKKNMVRVRMENGTYKAWNKGVKGIFNHSEYTKKIISNSLKGEKAHNWRGGISTFNQLVRSSGKYKGWVISVFKRDNYICQKCKVRGKNLHAHHIRNFAEVIELRFILSNGITLCNYCHKEFHKIYGKTNNNLIQLNQYLYVKV